MFSIGIRSYSNDFKHSLEFVKANPIPWIPITVYNQPSIIHIKYNYSEKIKVCNVVVFQISSIHNI